MAHVLFNNKIVSLEISDCYYNIWYVLLALLEELVWVPRTHIRWFTTRESDAPFWPLRALTYTSALTYMCTKHTCIFTHVHSHIDTVTCTFTHTCIHTDACSHTCAHIYTRVLTHVLNTHALTRAFNTHALTHVHIHIDIPLYTSTKRNLYGFLKW